MLLLGVAALAACVGVGVISREFVHFWWALVLLGHGWNFLFVGGTVLLTSSYRPSERFKAQGLNDFIVQGVQAFTALSAGSVLFSANWSTLNLLNLPALALVLAAVLLLRPRNPPRQGAKSLHHKGHKKLNHQDPKAPSKKRKEDNHTRVLPGYSFSKKKRKETKEQGRRDKGVCSRVMCSGVK